MQKIYFIRHGERNNNIPGSPLSARGREEAQITAKYLKTIFSDKKVELLASPIGRTQETASAIAKELDLRIQTVDWLSINSRLPEGQNSGADFLKLIEGRSRNLILVTHSQTIRNFLSKLFLGEEQLVKILDADFKTCSISVVEVEGDGFELEELAGVEHLKK